MHSTHIEYMRRIHVSKCGIFSNAKYYFSNQIISKNIQLTEFSSLKKFLEGLFFAESRQLFGPIDVPLNLRQWIMLDRTHLTVKCLRKCLQLVLRNGNMFTKGLRRSPVVRKKNNHFGDFLFLSNLLPSPLYSTMRRHSCHRVSKMLQMLALI